MTNEADYAAFDEVHGKGDKLYAAIFSNVDSKFYSIKGKTIKESKEDLSVGDFKIFYPEDTEILYLILDKVHVLFGKNYSSESLKTFMGILNKLESSKKSSDELEVEFLIPNFRFKRKWFKDYLIRIDQLKFNMEKIFSNDRS